MIVQVDLWFLRDWRSSLARADFQVLLDKGLANLESKPICLRKTKGRDATAAGEDVWTGFSQLDLGKNKTLLNKNV